MLSNTENIFENAIPVTEGVDENVIDPEKISKTELYILFKKLSHEIEEINKKHTQEIEALQKQVARNEQAIDILIECTLIDPATKLPNSNYLAQVKKQIDKARVPVSDNEIAVASFRINPGRAKNLSRKEQDDIAVKLQKMLRPEDNIFYLNSQKLENMLKNDNIETEDVIVDGQDIIVFFRNEKGVNDGQIYNSIMERLSIHGIDDLLCFGIALHKSGSTIDDTLFKSKVRMDAAAAIYFPNYEV